MKEFAREMGFRRRAALVLLAVSTLAAVAAAETALAGRWQGAIELPGQKLEVAVRIAGEAGAWSGTIDIPAQNARNLPLSAFEVSPEEVKFSIAGIPGAPTFRGTLSPEGAGVIAGQLTQGGQTFAFRLERLAAPPVDWTARLKAHAAEPGTGPARGGPETSERKKGTKPAHALEEYAGDYAHPTYGVISVSRDGGSGLKATLQGVPMKLEHWHYETFRVVFEDPALANENMFVLFRTNVKGDIDALEMPLEPQTREIVFEKRHKP